MHYQNNGTTARHISTQCIRIWILVIILSICRTSHAQTPSSTRDAQYYASKYDHLNVDSVLNNRRMVRYYASCLLSKGPCPPQGLEIRKILPEALHTNCARCTEKQKAVTYYAIRRLRKEYPKIWDELETLWDPNREFIQTFEHSFENRKKDMPISTSTTTMITIKMLPSTTSSRPTEVSIGSRFGNEIEESETSTLTKSSTVMPQQQYTTAKPRKPTRPSTSTAAPGFPTRNPQYNVVAGLKATVSLGTEIVNGFVRGLGEIGDRVVMTGAKLADAVISAVVKPRTTK